MSLDFNDELQDASLDYLQPHDDYRTASFERQIVNRPSMKSTETKVEEFRIPQIIVQPPMSKRHMEKIRKQLSLDSRPGPRKMVRRVKVGAMPDDTSSIGSGPRHPPIHEHGHGVANLFHNQFHHRENYITEALLAKFNKQQLEEYHQLFSMFDTDGSGAIGSQELKEAIMSIGLQVNDVEIDNIIRDVDEDGNGEIDFGEFCHCMQKSQNLARTTNDEIARQCFEIFDQDKNGVITENEFKYIAKEIGGFSDELAEHVFHELDISSNGHLSADQFAAIVEDYLTIDHYKY